MKVHLFATVTPIILLASIELSGQVQQAAATNTGITEALSAPKGAKNVTPATARFAVIET